MQRKQRNSHTNGMETVGPIRVEGLVDQGHEPVIEITGESSGIHVSVGSVVVDLDRRAGDDLLHAVAEAMSVVNDEPEAA